MAITMQQLWVCAVFVVFWWRDKGLQTLNRMHNEVWVCAEISVTRKSPSWECCHPDDQMRQSTDFFVIKETFHFKIVLWICL